MPERGPNGRERCATLAVAVREVPVVVRRRANARRLTVRLRLDGEGVLVTIPAGARFADGLDLARRSADWIAETLTARPARVLFADGVILPLRGIDHRLRHQPGDRAHIRAEAGCIVIAGPADSLARRLEAWLRREARRDLSAQVAALAPRLGRAAGRISVRDTRSRWGCAANGNLSFSWRLILAPPPVLRYVAAHELGHLVERNHGPGFWALVESLVGDVAASRGWLRRHGPGLHRYG